MGLRYARRRRRRPGQVEEEVRGAPAQPARAGGSGAGLPLFLQRSAGGPAGARPAPDAVGELGTRGRPIQAKLTVGEPGDPFEQEAARVADDAVDCPRPLAPSRGLASGFLASLGAPPGQADPADGGNSTDLDEDGLAEAGSGRPLPPLTRHFLEMRLGAEFGAVRVHDDSRAADLNRSIGAEAFTTGHDIYFAAGRYQPGTKPGLKLIAHELTHVVQQDASLARPDRGGAAIDRAPASTGASGVQRQLGFLTDPLAGVFDTVVATNILVATPIAIPSHFFEKLIEYASDHPDDGAILILGFIRLPIYYSGGWILDVQTGAKAMTLDDSVFVDGNLDIGTYIHEMVHVWQYGVLGRTNFLTSYFGLSAATIAWRFINQEPLDVMQSSPHENQAYELESRFLAWYASHP